MFAMKKEALFVGLATVVMLAGCGGEAPEPEPYGAVPTADQLAWMQMETNMMCHFGPNTFTDVEWGDGAESESVFMPTDLDCHQWVDVALAGGMKGIVLTAKHHDGFCLWPSLFSRHTVAQSPWRDGKGDVLREFSDACEGRIKKGFYLSPWDRHDPSYGTDSYNEVFVNTLREVLSGYGSVYEQWFDGANGEGPDGRKQTYDWDLFNRTVKESQPHAVVFSDVGPGCRWVGNEEGRAGETCWATLNVAGHTPGAGAPALDKLTQGEAHGAAWVPAEADVSIRPGWFYHENEQPKSVDELMEIYYNSVGRNALMMLNVPIDRRGRIAAEDSLRLVEFRAERERVFAHDLAKGAIVKGKHRKGDVYAAKNLTDSSYHSYWAQDDDASTAEAVVEWPQAVRFDMVVLQEYIPLGQRVSGFHLDYRGQDGQWHLLAKGTTIGYKRIVRTENVEADALRLSVDSALATPILNRLSIYNSHE